MTTADVPPQLHLEGDNSCTLRDNKSKSIVAGIEAP
jgi:hypothetical protein